jgi:hypothetical protein
LACGVGVGVGFVCVKSLVEGKGMKKIKKIEGARGMEKEEAVRCTS